MVSVGFELLKKAALANCENSVNHNWHLGKCVNCRTGEHTMLEECVRMRYLNSGANELFSACTPRMFSLRGTMECSV